MSRWPTVLAAIVTTGAAWLSLSAAPPPTRPTPIEDELLGAATGVFQRAVDSRAAAIPASVLLQARGIAVFPAAAKAGFRYGGRGIFSARGANRSYWTPPAVLDFKGTIPFDLESETVDFMLVALTPRGLDCLMLPRFESPVVFPIVAGALGRDTRVRTNADLLAYVQFADYFAGITVRDWITAEAREANGRLYGRPYSTDEIVRGEGFFRLPPAARSWRGAIADYFRAMS